MIKREKAILYNMWGYLSDKIGISSPCGNATYVPWIFDSLLKNGYKVYCCVDRDKESVLKYGKTCFDSFSQTKRWEIYNKINFIGLENVLNGNLPQIDILFLEWRFLTSDSRLPPNAPGYSPDLKIQEKLIWFCMFLIMLRKKATCLRRVSRILERQRALRKRFMLLVTRNSRKLRVMKE